MPTDVRILRARERAAAPWANGGGVTREVAAHPPGAGWDAFAWRVSLADVTRDGPYSPLPGVRRILTVVDGAGLELTVDGTAHPLPGRYRPFSFPGGADTDCRLLAGPVVNLNVMLRDGRAAATVEVVRGSRTVAPGRSPGHGDGGGDHSGQAVMVVALEGRTELRTEGGTERREDPVVRLERFDAALLTPESLTGNQMPVEVRAVALRTDGVAAVISLSGGGAVS
ncbi:HutD family protein [Streptomyces sp. NPDC048595]|uniref:HutD/Ves family protein n=1 Tax=Streptomyces sp. NPDC048595 TaxID=3365576 RepID=UPI00371DBBD0